MREIDLPSNHSSDRAGAPILAIVVHATAGTDSRGWLVQNPDGVSCNRLIRKDGLIYRMVPDSRAAHHVGYSQITLRGKTYGRTTKPNTNQITLGVELENLNNGKDPYPRAQLDALAWCLQDWLIRYPDVILFDHASIDTKGKTDPAGLSMRDLYALCAPVAVPPPPPPALTYAADSPIIASPAIDDAVLEAAMLALAKTDDPRIVGIVRSTIRTARAGGVDPVLALAQQAHETALTGDPYTSWWAQLPRRNLAGIGVTGAVSKAPQDMPPGPDWAWNGVRWLQGVSFGTDDAAITAQVGRLLAYAVPGGQETDQTSNLIFYALSVRGLPARCRGSAKTLRTLGHGPNPIVGCGWAGANDDQGLEYGARIANWANKIVREL